MVKDKDEWPIGFPHRCSMQPVPKDLEYVLYKAARIEELKIQLSNITSIEYADKFLKSSQEIAYSNVEPNHEAIIYLLENEIYDKTIRRITSNG